MQDSNYLLARNSALLFFVVAICSLMVNYVTVLKSHPTPAYQFQRVGADVIIETVVSPPAPKVKVIPTSDLRCLAENIYYEARNQSMAGKIAVGMVTLNRTKTKGYPNTVCKVVYQTWVNPETEKEICQFSWTCNGAKENSIEPNAWRQSENIARMLLKKEEIVVDIIEGATHFHANTVTPSWSKTLTKVAVIDDHLFYR